MSRWEKFLEEEVEDLSPMRREVEVPFRRAHRGSPSLVFNTPNKWGYGLKMVIRRVAKKLPEYHLNIRNPNPDIYRGRDDHGKPIPVNTLGRWAFGVPGYMGHLVFEGGESDRIVIYYPEGSPQELISLLRKSVNLLE